VSNMAWDRGKRVLPSEYAFRNDGVWIQGREGSSRVVTEASEGKHWVPFMSTRDRDARRKCLIDRYDFGRCPVVVILSSARAEDSSLLCSLNDLSSFSVGPVPSRFEPLIRVVSDPLARTFSPW